MLSAVAVDAVENKSATSEHALHAKARAVMFYRRACELGDPQGCSIYRKSPEGLKVRMFGASYASEDTHARTHNPYPRMYKQHMHTRTSLTD
jgi:hypothetical protein